jgi:hypothetical protein
MVAVIAGLVLLSLLTVVRADITNRVPVLLPTLLLVTSNGVSVAATSPLVQDWGTVTDLDTGETTTVVRAETGWQSVGQLSTTTFLMDTEGFERQWLVITKE